MQPEYVCAECGATYGRVLPSVSTWHVGTCGVCEAEGVPVTEPRDFGGLNDNWRNHQED